MFHTKFPKCLISPSNFYISLVSLYLCSLFSILNYLLDLISNTIWHGDQTMGLHWIITQYNNMDEGDITSTELVKYEM